MPAERFAIEATLLGALPRRRFDTAYVEARRVHVAIPQIEWRGVRYSVPPRCLGQRVEVRQEVESDSIEIRWAGRAGRLVIGFLFGAPKRCGTPSTSPTPRPLRSRRTGATTWPWCCPTRHPLRAPIRLDIEGDVEVEVPDLSRYETGSGS